MTDKNSNEKLNRRLARTVYQNVKRLLPLSTRIFLTTCVIRVVNRIAHLDRTLLSSKYLRGDGLEIGALHAPLQVSSAAKVKYVDRWTLKELREVHPELDSFDIIEPDILDDGQRLGTVLESSQDFVIANHFLEHCQNPLEALKNIYRVLRVGGLLFLALPDKRFTFDIDRPVTDIEHVLRDFEEGPEWSKRSHYDEWVRVVEKVSEDDAETRIQELTRQETYIHFHVWTQYEMFELLECARKRLGLNFEIESFLKAEAECVFVLRKNEPPPEGVSANYRPNAVKVFSEADELTKDA